MPRHRLIVKQLLAWADAHLERTGHWPNCKRGIAVKDAPDEKWRAIDGALRRGLRGLHRGQSLARLLAKHRGRRNRKALPKYTIRQVLAWADAHHSRTGRWPHKESGLISEAPGESWNAVEAALRGGIRGLRGGNSLAKLLAAKRGKRNRLAPSRLTVRQILDWADAHHWRTGNWPTGDGGAIQGSAGETWAAIDSALRRGKRGLRRSSLSQLLARHRMVRRHPRWPPLTIDRILRWADAHRKRTGEWPTSHSGKIPAAPGENWQRMDAALRLGRRGLPGGTTLARLLAEHRGRWSNKSRPPLTAKQILRWARAHKRLTGRWPNRNSGSLAGSGGETWAEIRSALRIGGRGLRRRITLTKLIESRAGRSSAR